jgi:anti-sigma factor RsiW
MKVTRDVIYDLLPAYFADELSTDSRALVEEFLATDPEFARMTERFRRLFEQRGTDSQTNGGTERQHFERARKRAEHRQTAAAFAIAYGLAAIFPLALDLLRSQPTQPKSIILAVIFGVVALGSAVSWFWNARLRAA